MSCVVFFWRTASSTAVSIFGGFLCQPQMRQHHGRGQNRAERIRYVLCPAIGWELSRVPARTSTFSRDE